MFPSSHLLCLSQGHRLPIHAPPLAPLYFLILYARRFSLYPPFSPSHALIQTPPSYRVPTRLGAARWTRQDRDWDRDWDSDAPAGRSLAHDGTNETAYLPLVWRAAPCRVRCMSAARSPWYTPISNSLCLSCPRIYARTRLLARSPVHSCPLVSPARLERDSAALGTRRLSSRPPWREPRT